jgi:hypothetical protein
MNKIKTLLVSAACIASTAALADQSSVLCKTTDTNEYIDIVSKSATTNDVLIQINGGNYFDGSSMMMGKLLIVTATFRDGGFILNLKPDSSGSMMISISDKFQTHPVSCRFR